MWNLYLVYNSRCAVPVFDDTEHRKCCQPIQHYHCGFCNSQCTKNVFVQKLLFKFSNISAKNR